MGIAIGNYQEHMGERLSQCWNEREAMIDSGRATKTAAQRNRYNELCNEILHCAAELVKHGIDAEIGTEESVIHLSEDEIYSVPTDDLIDAIGREEFYILFPDKKPQPPVQSAQAEAAPQYSPYNVETNVGMDVKNLLTPYITQGLFTAMSSELLRIERENAKSLIDLKDKYEKKEEEAKSLSEQMNALKESENTKQQELAEALRRYKEISEKYEEIKNDGDKKIANIQRSLLAEKQKTDQEINSLRSALKSLQEEYKKAEERAKAAEDDLARLRDSLKDEKSLLANEAKRYEEQINALEAEKNDLEAQLQDVISQYNAEKKRADELENANNGLSKKLASINSKKEDAERAVKELEGGRDGLSERIRSLESTIASLKKDKAELESALGTTKEALEVAKSVASEKEALEREVKNLLSEKSNLEKKARKADGDSSSLQDEVARLNNEISALRGDLKKTKRDLEAANVRAKDAEREKEEAIKSLNSEKETQKSLKKEADTLKAENHTLSEIANKDVKFQIGNSIALHSRLDTDKDAVSLGAVDIVGMSAINRQYGEENGDEAIRMALETLKDAFGDENVYRTRGAQFVVVSEASTIDLKNTLDQVCVDAAENDINLVYGISQIIGEPGASIKKATDSMHKALDQRMKRTSPKPAVQPAPQQNAQPRTYPAQPGQPAQRLIRQAAPQNTPVRNSVPKGQALNAMQAFAASVGANPAEVQAQQEAPRRVNPNVNAALLLKEDNETERTVKETDATTIDMASEVLNFNN